MLVAPSQTSPELFRYLPLYGGVSATLDGLPDEVPAVTQVSEIDLGRITLPKQLEEGLPSRPLLKLSMSQNLSKNAGLSIQELEV